jgi:hypothetical protein
MLNILAGRKLLVYSTNISAIHHTNKIKIATINSSADVFILPRDTVEQ